MTLLPPTPLEFIGTTYGASESKNFTLDTSPLFAVKIATTSPFYLSTPNIVIMTLKTSSPFPVSAWIGFAIFIS